MQSKTTGTIGVQQVCTSLVKLLKHFKIKEILFCNGLNLTWELNVKYDRDNFQFATCDFAVQQINEG